MLSESIAFDMEAEEDGYITTADLNFGVMKSETIVANTAATMVIIISIFRFDQT
jgi:hypothetical protein